MKASPYSRRYMLHVCKDGTVTYRDTAVNEPIFNGVAIAVFSVDTVEQAKAIQIRFCRRGYEPHPKQPDRPHYVLSTLGEGYEHFGLFKIDDLPKITRMFQAFYDKELSNDRRQFFSQGSRSS